MRNMMMALALGAAVVPAAAASAQVAPGITGTRLEISATGEATRVPDLAIISAGVSTRQSTASAAIQENATRMERVLAALKKAGIADRDVQTSSINLNPEYRYQDNQAPQLVGYTASNQVSIRFRDIRNSGKILDALVAEGANQINGPSLTIDKQDEALDEARAKAIANGQARAEFYARALGKRVVRLVSVSEGGGGSIVQPLPMVAERSIRCGRYEDRARRTKSVGYPFDGVRRSVSKKKAARRCPRRPVLLGLVFLANRSAPNEVHDRQKDDRAQQRIKEALDRNPCVHVLTEEESGDYRAYDTDDYI